MLGLELRPVLDVRSPSDLEKAFQSATEIRAAAGIRMIDPVLFMVREETAELATKYLPVIYPTKEDVEAGGLIAYGTNIPEQFRQAATFVDRILRGRKPADIPVEQPTKFELLVNLKFAKQIGLTIRPNVLARADRVIK